MATVTALSKNVVTASCPQQQWVIHNLSALKEAIKLPEFVVEGVSWCVNLHPASNQKIPGIFLQRVTKGSSRLKVKFAVKLIDRLNRDKSIDHEFERSFEGETSWGWPVPENMEQTSPALIKGDKLVLRTHVWLMKDLSPGLFNELLHEESHNFLARACLRLYRGENTSHPDVMLKVEDDKLPAHRALLAESSEVFKAMFQSGMSESRSEIVEIQEVAAEDMNIILKYIYGTLDALPEERLHHLVLAADRLQMTQLMEHCVSRLKLRFSQDTFAETAIVADKVSHQGLHEACVEFAVQEKNRSALGEHEGLKRIIVDAPDLAFRLIGDILKQSVPKTTAKKRSMGE